MFARRPAQLLAAVIFAGLLGVLIVVFASGQESTPLPLSSGNLNNTQFNASSGTVTLKQATQEITLPAASTTSATLQQAINQAATNPTYTPIVATSGPAAGLGPDAPQGVVHILYDPSSQPFSGANQVLLGLKIDFVSNVRLVVDSGVSLVYTANDKLFNLINADNVTITRGDASRGSGLGAGRYEIDLSRGLSGAYNKGIVLDNTSHFEISWLYSHQTPVTNSAVIVSHGDANNLPRYGLIEHQTNDGSPSGYGPTQLTSLNHVYIFDLWSDGGTTLRLETDGVTAGVHNVVADHIYGQNGNRVVTFTPHCANSDHVVVTDVAGVSMFDGVKLGSTSAKDSCTPGLFTNSSITTGCIVAGTNAEAQVPTGSFLLVPPRTTSQTVFTDASAPGTTVSVSKIGFNQSLVNFVKGTNGGDSSVACTPQIAQWPIQR